jgi:Flp pilus assembly secretin CpaC
MMHTAARRDLLVAAILLFSTPASFAGEGAIEIFLNEAKIVKLSRAADTVIIGNPKIADASIKDSKTIVLTGNYFGQTNFVVLDAKGNPIVDQQISVSRAPTNTVNVFRQSNVQTYSCTPHCENVYKSEVETAVQTGAAAQ